MSILGTNVTIKARACMHIFMFVRLCTSYEYLKPARSWLGLRANKTDDRSPGMKAL